MSLVFTCLIEPRFFPQGSLPKRNPREGSCAPHSKRFYPMPGSGNPVSSHLTTSSNYLRTI